MILWCLITAFLTGLTVHDFLDRRPANRGIWWLGCWMVISYGLYLNGPVPPGFVD